MGRFPCMFMCSHLDHIWIFVPGVKKKKKKQKEQSSTFKNAATDGVSIHVGKGC